MESSKLKLGNTLDQTLEIDANHADCLQHTNGARNPCNYLFQNRHYIPTLCTSPAPEMGSDPGKGQITHQAPSLRNLLVLRSRPELAEKKKKIRELTHSNKTRWSRDAAPLHERMKETGPLIDGKDKQMTHPWPVDGARTLPLYSLNP